MNLNVDISGLSSSLDSTTTIIIVCAVAAVVLIVVVWKCCKKKLGIVRPDDSPAIDHDPPIVMFQTTDLVVSNTAAVTAPEDPPVPGQVQ